MAVQFSDDELKVFKTILNQLSYKPADWKVVGPILEKVETNIAEPELPAEVVTPTDTATPVDTQPEELPN